MEALRRIGLIRGFVVLLIFGSGFWIGSQRSISDAPGEAASAITQDHHSVDHGDPDPRNVWAASAESRLASPVASLPHAPSERLPRQIAANPLASLARSAFRLAASGDRDAAQLALDRLSKVAESGSGRARHELVEVESLIQGVAARSMAPTKDLDDATRGATFVLFDDDPTDGFPESELKSCLNQVRLAEERLRANDTIENRVTLASWRLLAGEWSSDHRVRRFARSVEHFQRGLSLFEAVERDLEQRKAQQQDLEGEWESDEGRWVVAVHLDAMRVRAQALRQKADDVKQKVDCELDLLRLLTREYRSVANDIALSHRDFQLEAHSSATVRLENASRAIRRIDELRATWVKVGLPAEFLLHAEPDGPEPSPSTMPAFGDELVDHLPALQALVGFRAAERATGEVRQRLLGDVDRAIAKRGPHSNPVLHYVHAASAEMRGVAALADRPGESGRRETAASHFATARQAWAATVDGVREFQQAHQPPQIIRTTSGDGRLFASTSLHDVLKELAADEDDKERPGSELLTMAESRLRQLLEPQFFRDAATAILRAADGPMSVHEARNLLERAVQRHADADLWFAYLEMCLRSGMPRNQLRALMDDASSAGILPEADHRTHLLRAVVDIEVVESQMRTLRADLIGPITDRSSETDADVRRRLATLGDRLSPAFGHLEQARRLCPLTNVAERARCDAFSALTGVLRMALDTDSKGQNRFSPAECQALCLSAIESLEPTRKDSLNHAEALIAALHAQGLLGLILASDTDDPETASLAFAAANDLRGELPYVHAQYQELGTLSLQLMLRRRSEAAFDQAFRRERAVRVTQSHLLDAAVAFQFGDFASGLQSLKAGREKSRRRMADSAEAVSFDAFRTLLRSNDDSLHTTSLALDAYRILGEWEVWNALRRSHGPLPDAEVAAAAEDLLRGAVAVAEGRSLDEIPSTILPSIAALAVERVRTPLNATTLALSLEARLISLPLRNADERNAWRDVLLRSLERAETLHELAAHDRYPALKQMQTALRERVVSPELAWDRGTRRRNRFALAEAGTIAAEGLLRHPTSEKLWHLWFEAAHLRSVLGVPEMDLDSTDLMAASKILEWWKQARPEETAARHEAEAAIFRQEGRFDQSALSFSRALSRLSADDRTDRLRLTALRADSELRALSILEAPPSSK